MPEEAPVISTTCPVRSMWGSAPVEIVLCRCRAEGYHARGEWGIGLDSRSREEPGSTDAELVQKAAKNLLCVEVLLGQLARPPRVACVVALDLVEGGGRLLDRSHREEPLATRQVLTPPGVLHDDGAPARKEDGCTVAEPAVVRRDEAVLGHGELAARAANVRGIRLERGRDLVGIANAPA